jgi:hypothetical protein
MARRTVALPAGTAARRVHVAKLRQARCASRATQAVHETSARTTHDIKNLLQS